MKQNHKVKTVTVQSCEADDEACTDADAKKIIQNVHTARKLQRATKGGTSKGMGGRA